MARPNQRRWAAPSKYPRTARINEVLREVIASELEREQDEDPRLTLVTVTGVDTEGDLRHATVYFSALGTKASIEEVLAALEERRVPIQSAVGRSVRMKRTPQLRFIPDPGIIEGLKMENLLSKIDIPADDPAGDEDLDDEIDDNEIETNPELHESRNDD